MDNQEKRKLALLKWAGQNGLMVCQAASMKRLVEIINEVALGVEAYVAPDGDVHFKHVQGFDYQEMVGLKLIIHADPKFRVKPEPEKPEEADDYEAEEDDAD